jgi:hypothetical protein
VASRSCGDGREGLHTQEQYEEGKFRPNQVRQTCDSQQRNRFSEYRKKQKLVESVTVSSAESSIRVLTILQSSIVRMFIDFRYKSTVNWMK